MAGEPLPYVVTTIRYESEDGDPIFDRHTLMAYSARDAADQVSITFPLWAVNNVEPVLCDLEPTGFCNTHDRFHDR